MQQRGSQESAYSYECECMSFSTLVANNLRAPRAKGQILIRLGIIDCHSALAQLRPKQRSPSPALTHLLCPCTSCRTQNAHSRREWIHYMLKTEAKKGTGQNSRYKRFLSVSYMGWWELLFTPTQGKYSSSFGGLCRHIGCNYENVCSDTLKNVHRLMEVT